MADPSADRLFSKSSSLFGLPIERVAEHDESDVAQSSKSHGPFKQAAQGFANYVHASRIINLYEQVTFCESGPSPQIVRSRQVDPTFALRAL
jgi:hypothetical protein